MQDLRNNFVKIEDINDELIEYEIEIDKRFIIEDLKFELMPQLL